MRRSQANPPSPQDPPRRHHRQHEHAQPSTSAPCGALVFFDYSGRECQAWGAVVDLPDGRSLELGGALPEGHGGSCEEAAYHAARHACKLMGLRGEEYCTDEINLARRQGLYFIHRSDPLHQRAHRAANRARIELERQRSPQQRLQGAGIDLERVDIDFEALTPREQERAARRYLRLDGERQLRAAQLTSKRRGSNSWQRALRRLQLIYQAIEDFIDQLRQLSRLRTMQGAT